MTIKNLPEWTRNYVYVIYELKDGERTFVTATNYDAQLARELKDHPNYRYTVNLFF